MRGSESDPAASTPQPHITKISTLGNLDMIARLRDIVERFMFIDSLWRCGK
jgi:hypothetical protein